MSNVQQTYVSFKDKWEQNKGLAFAETLKPGSDIFDWILTRNGVSTPSAFSDWLNPKQRILDAGCGNGRVTALLQRYASPSASIFGIDLTAASVAAENLKDLQNVVISKRDLLGDLKDLGLFDLIYCQEVLHHTADPEGAFRNLCQLLEPKGEIAIYVYKKKAPIREYADDLVRDAISLLPYETAKSEMREITELGKVLTELGVKVTVPEVKALGIEAGEYDIQRFIYHFFLKCFWNPELSMEDNVAINYDWYHPQLCTRHTLDEVEKWFFDAGLNVIHSHVDHYGITVRGMKRG